MLESFGEIIKEHSRSTAVTTTMLGKDSKTRKPLQGSLNRRVEEEDESDSEENQMKGMFPGGVDRVYRELVMLR